MAQRARRVARRLGLDVRRYRSERAADVRRQKQLEQHAIDLVLDIGANEGQFGSELRAAGYRGRIVSFEPLADEYAALERRVGKDDRWECRRLAIGERSGATEIHVSRNRQSSSLLPILERHLSALPSSAYVGTETVEMARLDDLVDELLGADGDAFLKLDAQGYEKRILAGAEATLRRCPLLETELSLVPLWEGQPLLGEMVERLRGLGYSCLGFHEVLSDPETAQVLQVDGLFARL